MTAIAGGSRRHALVTTNLLATIAQQLRRRDCNVYSSQLRVHVREAGLYAYPDIVVTCGEEEFLDDAFETLLNPAVIIEVLPKYTCPAGRAQKFASYRECPSVSEYLAVSHDKMHVEHYRRQSDGGWLLTDFSDPSRRIRFESVGVELQVSDIYEKVKFE